MNHVKLSLLDYFPEYDDIEIEFESESDHGSDNCDEVDLDVSNHSEEEERGDQDSPSILSTILIIFFRIMHHFNISNNAASAILSFISLVLGMTVL